MGVLFFVFCFLPFLFFTLFFGLNFYWEKGRCYGKRKGEYMWCPFIFGIADFSIKRNGCRVFFINGINGGKESYVYARKAKTVCNIAVNRLINEYTRCLKH